MGGEERREFLGRLLRRYMPALWTYLMARLKLPLTIAERLTQDFVTDRIIAENLLKRLDRERGSPRTFLLVALHHYAVRVLDTENKESRRTVPLPPESSTDDAEPCQQAILVWARETVARARQLMQEECESDRPDVSLVFTERVLRPAYEGRRRTPARELARLLKVTPEQVSNLLVTGKRRFATALRRAVGETVTGEREIDGEIKDLMRVLSAR